MQVSATLIAAQQAAREAQARFREVHAPAKASFAAALGETAKPDAFSPLPLKQTAPSAAAPAAAPQPEANNARPGTFLDITI